jgi:hypothetical protein
MFALYLELALPAVNADPSAFPTFARTLAWAVSKGRSTSPSSLGVFLNRFLLEHARKGHGHEVTWALWAFGVLGIPVDSEPTQQVASMIDNFACVMLLSLQRLGMAPQTSIELIEDLKDDPDCQRSENWFLAYEVTRSGEAALHSIKTDPVFMQMLLDRVSFLLDDWHLVLAKGIEDDASDHEDDASDEKDSEDHGLDEDDQDEDDQDEDDDLDDDQDEDDDEDERQWLGLRALLFY